MRGQRITGLALALIASAGLLWLAAWAVGFTTYVPGAGEAFGTLALLLAVEFYALANQYPSDTESELIRKLALERRIVPNLFGLGLGAGAMLHQAWPLGQAAGSALGAGVLFFAAGYLSGHFFVEPAPDRRDAAMPVALLAGAWSGLWLVLVAVFVPREAVLGVSLMTAVLAGANGAVFFPLRNPARVNADGTIPAREAEKLFHSLPWLGFTTTSTPPSGRQEG